MRKEAADKRHQIERQEEEAEQRRDMPVDDSKIVEQMFGFLPEGEQPQGEIEPGERDRERERDRMHVPPPPPV